MNQTLYPNEILEALCANSGLLSLERSREGELIVHAPTGGDTSSGNAEICSQLRDWWKTHRQGRVYDSNGGFYLPDGSMLSPDAAYLTASQFSSLTKKERQGFIPRCPAFVIELQSASDDPQKLEDKMWLWIANGAEVAWRINPYKRRVLVYGPKPMRMEMEVGPLLQGSGPVDGFVLNLDDVWACYE
jgi:Uma2 family endonuclease